MTRTEDLHREPLAENDPLVSFVVTNFNYGRFLSQALESVVLQTHRRREIVFVDDASTDQSWLIAQALRSKFAADVERFELRRLPVNSGKMAALNVAIPLIRGEYTIILDADDYLLPAYTTRTLRELIRRQGDSASMAFVYTNCTLVDIEGNDIGRGLSRDFDPALVDTASYIPDCALTDSRVLKAAIPLDEAIRVGTKHSKWKKICRQGYTGYHIPEPLFSYRMHDRNLSGIGRDILSNDPGKRKERLLSGYWPTSAR
jgi:glycosyltransferase involved in cell wall biosynthesis